MLFWLLLSGDMEASGEKSKLCGSFACCCVCGTPRKREVQSWAPEQAVNGGGEREEL